MKLKDLPVSKLLLALLVVLTLFLRLYNASDLSGGDDSQWAELATYAIQDPKLMIYPHMPDEPIQWQDAHYSRPFAVIPYVVSILIFGYTKIAIVFPAALFSALSVLLLFLLLRKFFDKNVALLACFFFAVSPFHLAFSRIGLLDASLIFYCLLAFWLLIKGFEENRPALVYISAFVWFINSTTTNIRGAVPIIAALPCIYFYLMKKRFDIKRLLKNRMFHHFLIAHVAMILLFVIYIALPLAWGQSGWVDLFTVMVQNAAGAIPGREYLSFWGAVKEMGALLIFTPFIGLVFIPMLIGLIISVSKMKKFCFSFWVFYIVGILFFYTQGQYAPQRQVIFVPAMAVFAALGIMFPYYHFTKNKNRLYLPAILALSFSYLFFMLYMFSRVFGSEFEMIYSMAGGLGLAGVLSIVLSYWWIFVLLMLLLFLVLYFVSKKRKFARKISSAYIIIIAALILINLVASVLLVHSGAGVYKRTESTGIVGNYLDQNLGDEKYSCVAAVHAKSFSFYTQRTCAFWVRVNTTWLDEQVADGDLKYFILNTHYPYRTWGVGNVLPDGSWGPPLGDSGWEIPHYEIYEWLQENTIDITDKTGLPGRNEFLVYELKK